MERAKALGVKPGKLFSDLIRGVAVRSENGSEVLPHQCLGPNVTGPVVLLIDCPDESFAASLFASKELQASLARADMICHLGDASVVSSTRFSLLLVLFFLFNMGPDMLSGWGSFVRARRSTCC